MTEYFWKRLGRSLAGVAVGLIICIVILLWLTSISPYR